MLKKPQDISYIVIKTLKVVIDTLVDMAKQDEQEKNDYSDCENQCDEKPLSADDQITNDCIKAKKQMLECSIFTGGFIYLIIFTLSLVGVCILGVFVGSGDNSTTMVTLLILASIGVSIGPVIGLGFCTVMLSKFLYAKWCLPVGRWCCIKYCNKSYDTEVI